MFDQDKLAIREVIENWALWRDAGDWDRFATVWHEDGWMTATWFQGPASEFIRVSREGFVDVVCTGRFYDFLEKRMPVRPKTDTTSDHSRWAIVRRQPIYEKDRMDPVDPAASLTLDPERLARFPEGYRHLAYLQSKIGFPVKNNLPGLRGAVVLKLYEEGRAWLAGSAEPGVPL